VILRSGNGRRSALGVVAGVAVLLTATLSSAQLMPDQTHPSNEPKPGRAGSKKPASAKKRPTTQAPAPATEPESPPPEPPKPAEPPAVPRPAPTESVPSEVPPVQPSPAPLPPEQPVPTPEPPSRTPEPEPVPEAAPVEPRAAPAKTEPSTPTAAAEGEKQGGLAAPTEGSTNDELWSVSVLFLGEYTHLLDSTQTRGSSNIYAARLDATMMGVPGAPAFSMILETALGGTSGGLYYDLTGSLGCGGWLSRWLGLGALLGVGFSEVTGGVMPFAIEVPSAQAWVGVNLGSSLRVEARARATWFFLPLNDGDRMRYDEKPSTVPLERFVGGHVLFGRRSDASSNPDPSAGVALGLGYWEAMGTQAVIVQAGMGFGAGP
jgi:hypothetical protein